MLESLQRYLSMHLSGGKPEPIIMPNRVVLIYPSLIQRWVPHPSPKHGNITVSLLSGTVYCIRICVYFFLETWGRLMGEGRSYFVSWFEFWRHCIHETVAKHPEYNYFSSSARYESWSSQKTAILFHCSLPVSACFYIHWELSTFHNGLHSLKLFFLHEQFHQH